MCFFKKKKEKKNHFKKKEKPLKLKVTLKSESVKNCLSPHCDNNKATKFNE